MTDLINTIKYGNNKNIPIWIMRQAGRYLPEYRNIRIQNKDFLKVCLNPTLSSEITMQPLNRFDLDAAIIFSDILVLPFCMGMDIKFVKDIGPQVKIINQIEEIKKLKLDNGKISKVYESISKVRKLLKKNKTLIGFAGGPWTVATYLLENKRKGDNKTPRCLIYQNRELVDILIDILTNETIKHLKNQIKNGADIVQIFESWASTLSCDNYYKYVIKPNKKIVNEIKKEFPEVKIIGFPKGSGYLYEDYISETKIDVIGVDYTVNIKEMKKFQDKVAVQGNLDPSVLMGSKEDIIESASKIINAMQNGSFIFNLGHGIFPETSIEKVQILVDYVKNYGR